MEQYRPKENSGENKSGRGISRRDFLKKTGIITAGLIAESMIPQSLLAKEDPGRTEREIREEIKASVEKLKNKSGLRRDEFAIVVNPEKQELCLVLNGKIVKTYIVSTGQA